MARTASAASRHREPIAIFGEGEERRDHVAVEDVARPRRLILHIAAPAR